MKGSVCRYQYVLISFRRIKARCQGRVAKKKCPAMMNWQILSMYSRKALRFIGKVLGSDQFGGPRTKTRDEEHESDQEVLALR